MTPPPYELTAGHLKLARAVDKHCDGNMSELARQVGVSRQAVDRWMRERVAPNKPHAKLIQELYGIPVSDWYVTIPERP